MKHIIATILSLLSTLRADKKLGSTSAKSTDCTIKVKRMKNNTIRIDLVPVLVSAAPNTTANPFK